MPINHKPGLPQVFNQLKMPVEQLLSMANSFMELDVLKAYLILQIKNLKANNNELNLFTSNLVIAKNYNSFIKNHEENLLKLSKDALQYNELLKYINDYTFYLANEGNLTTHSESLLPPAPDVNYSTLRIAENNLEKELEELEKAERASIGVTNAFNDIFEKATIAALNTIYSKLYPNKPQLFPSANDIIYAPLIEELQIRMLKNSQLVKAMEVYSMVAYHYNQNTNMLCDKSSFYQQNHQQRPIRGQSANLNKLAEEKGVYFPIMKTTLCKKIANCFDLHNKEQIDAIIDCFDKLVAFRYSLISAKSLACANLLNLDFLNRLVQPLLDAKLGVKEAEFIIKLLLAAIVNQEIYLKLINYTSTDLDENLKKDIKNLYKLLIIENRILGYNREKLGEGTNKSLIRVRASKPQILSPTNPSFLSSLPTTSSTESGGALETNSETDIQQANIEAMALRQFFSRSLYFVEVENDEIAQREFAPDIELQERINNNDIKETWLRLRLINFCSFLHPLRKQQKVAFVKAVGNTITNELKDLEPNTNKTEIAADLLMQLIIGLSNLIKIGVIHGDPHLENTKVVQDDSRIEHTKFTCDPKGAKETQRKVQMLDWGLYKLFPISDKVKRRALADYKYLVQGGSISRRFKTLCYQLFRWVCIILRFKPPKEKHFPLQNILRSANVSETAIKKIMHFANEEFSKLENLKDRSQQDVQRFTTLWCYNIIATLEVKATNIKRMLLEAETDYGIGEVINFKYLENMSDQEVDEKFNEICLYYIRKK